jgi:hypothetical protein
MNSSIGNVGSREQCSCNGQKIWISLYLKSAPSANLRGAAICSDNHSCTQRLLAAFVLERDFWKPIRPRIDTQHLRATLHLDAVDTGTPEQRFLQAGMVDIQ